MSSKETTALVLSGGGSRAAYQAGVLKAVEEIAPHFRFSIITGFSAGAINASYLAAGAEDLKQAVTELCDLWERIKTDKVFTTNPVNVLHTGVRLMFDLGFGGLRKRTNISALLNTSPLRKTLQKHIDFKKIRENISKEQVDALAVFATDYGTAESVCFYDERGHIEPWIRMRRRAKRTDFHVDHIMASAALPLLFPPIQVDETYFGDGCLRNVAPLSPAVHLGGRKVFIVGVRRQKEALDRIQFKKRPSLGRVLSVVLNAILLDTTDMDVERMARINRTLSLMSAEDLARSPLKPIDFIWMTPSQDIGDLAKNYVKELPWVIRYLLRGTGSESEFSEIASYLLFESNFCKTLVELGYQDGLQRRDEILKFFENK